jgi:hypothetical protein
MLTASAAASGFWGGVSELWNILGGFREDFNILNT